MTIIDHAVTVPLTHGTFRQVRILAPRYGMGRFIAAIVAEHLRKVDIGRRLPAKVELFAFDEGSGP